MTKTGDIMAMSGSLHKLFSRSSPKEEETPFDSEERLLTLLKNLAYNWLYSPGDSPYENGALRYSKFMILRLPSSKFGL
ncbi:hypothetical protein PRIPAC_88489 [Pristionchus pacificus]|uniref:Uncharacterized protein n=1 Tax=Pristionchus pacificus TaxID=54126 RepID=A0A2A6B775_PRIPA|nr:hypothetical protein PRIPAC_88489 [Pristionchus pacificus]|eukprot:PDM61739.1 hypothetical protein PRIPAC_51181 [Pristionchus pacificus]